jgi:galactosamine-6-phosphate isomerase
LVTPLGLGDRYVEFDGLAGDPPAECARVARWLERHGPIDVCVLGLGVNGHLGFNEPADALQPHAHVAKLSQASLAHAMVHGRAAPPTYGLTLGMADILQSRRILVLVAGAAKQQTLRQLLSGRITTQFPASLLQLHPAVQLLCDEAALGG